MLLFQIKDFLNFVKKMYSDLPGHLPKIFNPKKVVKIADMSEVNLEPILKETFSTHQLQSEKKMPDGTTATVNVRLHYDNLFN